MRVQLIFRKKMFTFANSLSAINSAWRQRWLC